MARRDALESLGLFGSIRGRWLLLSANRRQKAYGQLLCLLRCDGSGHAVVGKSDSASQTGRAIMPYCYAAVKHRG